MKQYKPFNEKLNAATANKECGLYLYDGFLPPDEAREALEILGDDTKFPWDTKPRLYGQSMTQHAYQHDRYQFSKKKKKVDSHSDQGLVKLEAICSKIERVFDVKISFVYCNRFQDPNHRVDWHKDTYGEHICVLTLGSKRRIEFRNNKTQQVEEVTPAAGDLYVMPLGINKTHKHRVCSAIETQATSLGDNDDPSGENNANTRLSFVFFFKAPSYATEFKISKKDRLVGYLEGVREMTGL